MTRDTTDDAPRRRTRSSRTRVEGVTIEEVARRSNVSVATVSRALRGLPNVAPSTRSRVEQVAKELHYQVDTYASRLATGRNDTVGLAVPNINNWYFSEAASGVEAVLAEAGLDVLLYSVSSGASRDRLLATHSAARRRLDGLVLIDVLLTREELERLAAENAHIVTVGQRTEHFPSVTIDNHGAAMLATRHLINLGHRTIALIGGGTRSSLPFDVPSARRQGYFDALAEHGLPHRPELEADGGFSVDGGAEAMVHLLSTSRPPSAVFAISDEMAMGALKTVHDLGLRVPEDVSIVGFDDHALAVVCGLTTVRQEPQWHGASAGRLLLGLEDDPRPETRHVVADTRLVVRNSSGPAPAAG